jgi:hypothetical protein
VFLFTFNLAEANGHDEYTEFIIERVMSPSKCEYGNFIWKWGILCRHYDEAEKTDAWKIFLIRE